MKFSDEVKKKISRRKFLKKTAGAVTAFSLGLKAAESEEEPQTQEPQILCGVIGTGVQGQTLLSQLVRMADVKVVALCDIYPPHLRKAMEILGQEVKTYEDYRQMLEENKEMQAVIVATPPAVHASISVAAMQAGKDVFCETPMALSVDECKQMAKVIQEQKRVFQVGNQYRYSPLYGHALKFVKAGAIGKIMQIKAQWHLKHSWRRAVSNPSYERILNWRLYKATSGGLLAEYGSLQLDVVNWFLRSTPVSVFGLGGIDHWKDGREVSDNLQVLFEYPDGVKVSYTATLSNSYLGYYELFVGTDGTILFTGGKEALMFRETDAAALGWEMYALKKKWADEMGIYLHADATGYEFYQKIREGVPIEEIFKEGKNNFYLALEDFFKCVRKRKRPECGALEGLRAVGTVIKANEAIEKGSRIEFSPDIFSL